MLQKAVLGEHSPQARDAASWLMIVLTKQGKAVEAEEMKMEMRNLRQSKKNHDKRRKVIRRNLKHVARQSQSRDSVLVQFDSPDVSI